MFSTRIPRDLTANQFSALIAKKQRQQTALIDLTESNPTCIGLNYPTTEILAAFANPAALVYEPQPQGLLAARQAIAQYYQARQISVNPSQIVITASTSESYTLLFKLLMNADYSVLVPAPSYPLFEHLATAESVQALTYPFYFDGDWHIDFSELRNCIKPETRAIIVVNPNNPTGSFIKPYEWEKLLAFCQEYQLALISDEVFADYCYQATHTHSAAAINSVLTFTLNGLSKAAALPQLKLGWIVVNGPTTLLQEALSRLEFLNDLFLSASGPVQHALSQLLPLATDLQQQLLERVTTNRQWLSAQLQQPPYQAYQLLPAVAGWYAILKVPRLINEEALVLQLLQADDVIIHPGYFFDFPEEGLLIFTLILPIPTFQTGMQRVLARLTQLLT
jgi:alanine-synthesizing transaminase